MARAAPSAAYPYGGSSEGAVNSSVPAGNSTSLHAVIYVHACRQSCPCAAAAQTVRRSSSLSHTASAWHGEFVLLRMSDLQTRTFGAASDLFCLQVDDCRKAIDRDPKNIKAPCQVWSVLPQYGHVQDLVMDSQEAPHLGSLSISWTLLSSPVTATTTFVASLTRTGSAGLVKQQQFVYGPHGA